MPKLTYENSINTLLYALTGFIIGLNIGFMVF